MARSRRPSLLRRLAVPFLSSTLLLGAGVAFIAVPEKVHGTPCHGSAVSVWLRSEEPQEHSHECHAKAVADLVFGSAVGLGGLVLAAVSIGLLRRPVPGLPT